MSAAGEKLSELQYEIGLVRAVVDLLNHRIEDGDPLPSGVSGGIVLLDDLSRRLVERSDDLERTLFDEPGSKRAKKRVRR